MKRSKVKKVKKDEKFCCSFKKNLKQKKLSSRFVSFFFRMNYETIIMTKLQCLVSFSSSLSLFLLISNVTICNVWFAHVVVLYSFLLVVMTFLLLFLFCDEMKSETDGTVKIYSCF